MFLFFVSVELIGEGNGEVAAHLVHVEVELLSFVVDAAVGPQAVEEVVALQLQFGLVVGEGPFQSGVYFPDRTEVVDALQGRTDVEAVQLEADVGLGREADGVVELRDALPFRPIEANGVVRVANILIVRTVQYELGIPNLADREGNHQRQSRLLLVVVVDELVNERELVGTLVGQLHDVVLDVIVIKRGDVFPFEDVSQLRSIVGRGDEGRIAQYLGIAVQVAHGILERPIVGVFLV